MTTTIAAVPAVTPTGAGGTWRLPIPLFSIPLGLAGLGGAWSAAAELLDASHLPADVAYAGAATLWATFTVAYVVGTMRHKAVNFRVDLRHPLLGPLTAYIPVIAVLLAAHYSTDLGAGARWLTYTSLVALAVNAAALVAHWLTAPLEANLTHPGYLLPVTAGPFIASIGLVSTGDERAAIAAFGVGSYFSLVLGGLYHRPRAFRYAPAQPFKPVLSIIVSPSANGWPGLVRHHGRTRRQPPSGHHRSDALPASRPAVPRFPTTSP